MSEIQYPSLVTGMPDPEYRAVDAASSTTLKTLWRKSPAHAKAQLDGLLGDDDRPCLVEGIAAHVGALQPQEFEKRYQIMDGDEIDLRTKDGKSKWADFQASFSNRICLRPTIGAQVLGMRAAIWACPEARALFLNATDVEVSAFWIDPATGLKCKARADILCRGLRCMPDLKTTISADPETFQYKAWDLAYHIQIAHYWAGLAANGIVIEDAPIIAVEKTYPHPVTVFDTAQDWLIRGEKDRGEALATLKLCRDTNVWPGYAKGLVKLDVPSREKWKEVQALSA